MITLFTIPKPFMGPIATLQRNAVTSWTRLSGGDIRAAKPCPSGPDSSAATTSPAPVEVLLLGDEPGTAALASELGLRHLPQVRCSDHGTPLVSDLFQRAHAAAGHDVLCYVNADIVLMSDFLDAARCVVRRKRQFLMVGQRWDTPVTDAIRFDDDGDWQLKLRDLASKKGSLHKPTGIDYFLFNKNLYGNPPRIPDFAVGRTAWDNWLIYRALALKAPVIDATASVLAVHQNHDYAHGGGYKQVWKGAEAKRNLELAGGPTHLYTIWDASHTLERQRIQPRQKLGLGGGIWNYRRSARSA